MIIDECKYMCDSHLVNNTELKEKYTYTYSEIFRQIPAFLEWFYNHAVVGHSTNAKYFQQQLTSE